jgi:alpha-tubulin suppressor-like RCC1 family protein
MIRRVQPLVAAAATAGALSVWAAPATAAITSPVLHPAVAGAAQMALSWTPATGATVTGYEVLRDGRRVGSTDGYTTTYLDTELQVGQVYRYEVVAHSASEAAASTERTEATASSTREIRECQSVPLGAGHYVLRRELQVTSGAPCLTFEATEGVSLDCAGHRIADAQGSVNHATALRLDHVRRFLVTNCGFYNPDPAGPGDAGLVELAYSEAGALDRDLFGAGQGGEGVSLTHSDAVALEQDEFTNAPITDQQGEGDYFGADVITEPSQSADEPLELLRGMGNVVDGVSLNGDASIAGYETELTEHWYPPGVGGADDGVYASAEIGDTIVDSHVDNVYDCGLETANVAAHDLFVGNAIDNAWAAGICSYWSTSWKENSVVDNSVADSGVLLAVGGSAESLARGPGGQVESANDFYGNVFEANTLSGGAWHMPWDYSTMIAPWAETALHERVSVGQNSFIDNDFGGSLPAPQISAGGSGEGSGPGEPLIVSSASRGNECRLPSPDLQCTAAEPPPVGAPYVDGLFPDQGPLAGGTLVAVEGADLSGATEVLFGSERAPVVDELQDSRLVVRAPATELAGPVDVRVVTPAGPSQAPSGPWPVGTADQFVYGQVPVVAALSPSRGASAGRSEVTITGTNLSGATSIDWGAAVEQSCSHTAEIQPCFSVQSANSIVATSEPDLDATPYVNVTVTTPAGTSEVTDGIGTELNAPGAANDEFTYAEPTVAPVVAAVEGDTGQEGGGRQVTITGQHFEGVEAVRFGARPALRFSVVSADAITATAPPGSGVVSVSVTNAAGAAAGQPFAYLPATASGWGEGLSGQLANGSTAGAALPAGLGELSELSGIAAGTSHALGVVEGGQVVAWGGGAAGQLGDGSVAPNATLPVPVCAAGEQAPCSGRLTEVSEVAAGEEDSLALLRSGQVLAWGANSSGQLGDASTVASDSPVPVMGLPVSERVVAIAAGYQDNLALTASGRVWAWGANRHGQLGDASFGNSSTPVPVEGLPSNEAVVAIAAGADHNLALLGDGRVWAWGANGYGELGDGAWGEGRDSPRAVEVAGLTEVTAISAGYEDSVALLRGGRVRDWGLNLAGELGNGAVKLKALPAVVCAPTGCGAQLTGVTAVAAGGFHNLALLEDGTVVGWGDNVNGQLGRGSSGSTAGPEFCLWIGDGCSRVPVAVRGLSGVTAIAAGARYSVATRASQHVQGVEIGDSLEAVSCVTATTECVISDGRGNAAYATNVSAAASATWNAWSGPAGQPRPSDAIDCPTSSRCLLADGELSGHGGALYVASSLGGSWTTLYTPVFGVDAISCASESVCVDGQDGEGFLRFSSTPDQPNSRLRSSWRLEEQGSAAITGVACIAPSFCAVVDGAGNVHVATSEAAVRGEADWATTDVDGSTPLRAVACTSASACYAVDGTGRVLEMAMNAAGQPTTIARSIDPGGQLSAIACVAGSLCVAADHQGGVYAAPGGGTWAREYALGDELTGLACASLQLCVATDASGYVTTFDPT